MGQHFILHEVLGPFFEGVERKKLTLSSEKAKAETTRLLAFLAPLLGPDPSAYGLEGLGAAAAPASTGGGGLGRGFWERRSWTGGFLRARGGLWEGWPRRLLWNRRRGPRGLRGRGLWLRGLL